MRTPARNFRRPVGRSVVVIGFVIVIAAANRSGAAEGEEPGRGFADTVARWFSPSVRESDRKLAEFAEQLNDLPQPGRTEQTARIGFHSNPMSGSRRPQWVQVDLGADYPIDAIAMIPAAIDTPLHPDRGYGFPVRFKVEASSEPEFIEPILIADHTGEDFPNPGRFPVLLKPDAVEARYVRVTSIRHFRTLEKFVWALGELMVLSGNYNVAGGKKVTASNTSNLPDTWSTQNLTDNHSIIGAPESSEPSPSNGWLGKRAKSRAQHKWVEVDLGKPVKADEVRLFAARPTDMADNPGLGFPAFFKLGVGTTRGVEEFFFDTRGKFFENPKGNAVVFALPDRPVRFIRMTTQRLWTRGNMRNFALAEMQVYANGENIALGKKVQASDSLSDPKSPRWAQKFLVDGFSSQYRLIELPEYLDQLDQRHRVERDMAALRNERNASANRVVLAVASGAGGLTLTAILGLSFALLRQSRNRRRETERLRAQIARDLHDDIGSNLGSIALSSQLAASASELSEEARRDFQEIHDVAESTAEAMRDIVWLIDTGNTTLADLAEKMRDAARRLVPDSAEYEIVIDRSSFDERTVSLRLRRHLFFAFKEALNNTRKHARAKKIVIEIGITGNRLHFRVEDDGAGFDPEAAGNSGRGLSNLNERANRLSGECDVVTRPDRGTVVSFAVPLGS